MTPLAESLLQCKVEGNTLHLPTSFLPNYQEVRTALLKAGAKYKRNTFVFPNDAQPYIDKLTSGETVNIKKEFQFFATPRELADRLVKLADIEEKHLILEPSAGQGAIVEAVIRAQPESLVHCYELMDINRNVLAKNSDAIILGEDYLTATPPTQFDRIIANPPFSKNQDIDHIRKMYKDLRRGGRMVTVASLHWRFCDNKKEMQFREWLDQVGSRVIELPPGEFEESGTKIAACIIIITKE